MNTVDKNRNRVLAAAKKVEGGDYALIQMVYEFMEILENYAEQFESFKAEKGSDLESFKENKSNELSSLWEPIETKIQEIHEEVEKGMIEGKKMGEEQVEALKTMTEGVAGFKELVLKRVEEIKGLIPEVPESFDPTDILNRVNEIELKIPKIPDELKAEQVRDKLETLEDDDRLDKSAIKGLEEEIKRLDKKIDSKSTGGGGGTSAIGVAQAFKYIGKTEQPVGAIDGVNTIYTVKNNIWWIAGFTINKAQIAELPNFTYINHTITFASPLPAAYSGKDFEIKYIGH